MKYAFFFALIALSACAAQPEYVDVEMDRAEQQQYLRNVNDRWAFRPEVYADIEFEADCVAYEMDECYE